MESIDPEALIEAVREGAVVIDLRPPTPRLRDRIPGSIPVALEAVRDARLPDIPHDAHVVVVCEWGRLSELAALYLEAHGFARVLHLRGGMAGLRKPKRPTGAKPGTESH